MDDWPLFNCGESMEGEVEYWIATNHIHASALFDGIPFLSEPVETQAKILCNLINAYIEESLREELRDNA